LLVDSFSATVVAVASPPNLSNLFLFLSSSSGVQVLLLETIGSLAIPLDHVKFTLCFATGTLNLLALCCNLSCNATVTDASDPLIGIPNLLARSNCLESPITDPFVVVVVVTPNRSPLCFFLSSSVEGMLNLSDLIFLFSSSLNGKSLSVPLVSELNDAVKGAGVGVAFVVDVIVVFALVTGVMLEGLDAGVMIGADAVF